jgi:hypothetical protein
MAGGALLAAALLAALRLVGLHPFGPRAVGAEQVAAKGNAEVAPLIAGAPAGSTSLPFVSAEGGVEFTQKTEVQP